MSANTGSKLAIVALFCVIFAVIGFLVYDLVFYFPRAVVSFTNDFSSAKTDIPFKINVNVMSLNYIAKDCTAGLELVSPDGRATTVSEQVLSLVPGNTVPLIFQTVVSSNNITGNYTAVFYLTGRRSVFFGKPSRFAELRKDFVVIPKKIDGTLNLNAPAENVTVKPGSKLVFSGTVSNTGETEQLISVDCIITPPEGIEINLGVQAKTLGVLEGEEFSFAFEAPASPAGKYKARVSLFSGNPNLPSGQKLKQVDRDFTVSKIASKASSGKPKPKGSSGAEAAVKPKADRAGAGLAGENLSAPAAAEVTKTADQSFGGISEISAKFTNTGGFDREFFAVIEAVDPSGKTYPLLGEKIRLKKGESNSFTKEFTADASMPDGKYKATASIWDRQGEDGKPVTKFSGQSAQFNVLDNPPSLSSFVYVAPELGKPGIITIKARDDKGIKDVRLVYKGPGMTEYAKESMIKTGGKDNLSGDYSVQTRVFTFNGSFMFYVEVIDSKGQKAKSTEEKTEIK